MVLVVYGTIAKNRWGINDNPVVCPHCNRRFPQIREPQNLRQALWGGGTCVNCGTEVDKWGRALSGLAQPLVGSSLQSDGQIRRRLRTKLVVSSSCAAYLTMIVFDCLEMSKWPQTVSGWLAVAAKAAFETVIFAIPSYFALVYLRNRFVLKQREGDTAQREERR